MPIERADVVEIAKAGDEATGPDVRALARLTDKQKAFIREYPKDYNAKQAAIRAGYSASNNGRSAQSYGWELLRHPVIGVEIRRLTKATPELLGITSEYVLVKLREIAENQVTDHPAAAVKALEHISKLRGDLVPDSTVVAVGVRVELNDVNVEDLK